MIQVAGTSAVDVSALSDAERHIYMKKNASTIIYEYETLEQLHFELKLRANIVFSSYDLAGSNAIFATFAESKCNPKYWRLTEFGGFQLRTDVTPAAGIRDLYVNGHLYAYECAVAMVIVLYKAILDTIGEAKFNRHFANLLLFSWNFDQDLRLITVDTAAESYPADILYFANPDVHPDTPQWQGENAVKIDDDVFYGHGLGITTSQGIIQALNALRRPFALRSAYLVDQATLPDYAHLYALASDSRKDARLRFIGDCIESRIGSTRSVKRFTGARRLTYAG